MSLLPQNNPDERSAVIVRTSLVGIGVNVLLAAMKAAVGLLSHSIAVVLDAVNNLSDALSSVITIVGTKLSQRRPDRKHPLGYGRIEYLSSMIVAALVLYAGLTSLTESIRKIITPQEADYSILSLVLIGAAVAAKLILGSWVKARGKAVDSGSLVASGEDARFDAILSASVLLCAILYLTLHISLEAWVGVVISVFIIKSGIEMMLETVNDILGKRTDPELSRTIKDLVCQEEGVLSAHDLLISNYGPGKNYATLHVEVPDDLTAARLDHMTRRITARVLQETGVAVVGVGIYAANTPDDEAIQVRRKVEEIVASHPEALTIHGYYLDREAGVLSYDVVFGFDGDYRAALEDIREKTRAAFPEFTVTVIPDFDISD